MEFPDISPYVFGLHWGAFGLRWYALAYVAGILLGWRYAVRLVKKPQLWGGRQPTLSPIQIDDLILWVTLGIIVGGRLGYVLFYKPNYYLANPLEIIQVWTGGMSFHGGLLGVTLAIVAFARIHKVDLFKLGDLVAPAVPIGLFFGRVANFINGELWGRETTVPWAIRFCNDTIRAANQGLCPAGEGFRHPSQLYEALLEGVLLFVVLRFATHRGLWLQRRGGLAGIFLAGYGLIRISLENVREPDDFIHGLPVGLTMGMLLSIPMVLIGGWLIVQAMRQPLLPAPADVPVEPASSKAPVTSKAKASKARK